VLLGVAQDLLARAVREPRVLEQPVELLRVVAPTDDRIGEAWIARPLGVAGGGDEVSPVVVGAPDEHDLPVGGTEDRVRVRTAALARTRPGAVPRSTERHEQVRVHDDGVRDRVGRDDVGLARALEQPREPGRHDVHRDHGVEHALRHRQWVAVGQADRDREARARGELALVDVAARERSVGRRAVQRHRAAHRTVVHRTGVGAASDEDEVDLAAGRRCARDARTADDAPRSDPCAVEVARVARSRVARSHVARSLAATAEHLAHDVHGRAELGEPARGEQHAPVARVDRDDHPLQVACHGGPP
jgi:hypothetical protein